jgi:hypothetical protein
MLLDSVFVGEQSSYHDTSFTSVTSRSGRDFHLVQALPQPQKVGPGAGHEGKCMSPAYDPVGAEREGIGTVESKPGL